MFLSFLEVMVHRKPLNMEDNFRILNLCYILAVVLSLSLSQYPHFSQNIVVDIFIVLRCCFDIQWLVSTSLMLFTFVVVMLRCLIRNV